MNKALDDMFTSAVNISASSSATASYLEYQTLRNYGYEVLIKILPASEDDPQSFTRDLELLVQALKRNKRTRVIEYQVFNPDGNPGKALTVYGTSAKTKETLDYRAKFKNGLYKKIEAKAAAASLVDESSLFDEGDASSVADEF